MKIIAAFAASMIATMATAQDAGMKEFNFEAPHHGRTVSGMIWYPSSTGGAVQRAAENAVFFGQDVRMNGELDDQDKKPLVLMSHGLGGNWRSSTWLATDLARRGAIVISVDHPNSTTFDFDMRAGLDHWTRAQDMSQALDIVLSDPTYADQIDRSRIMAAGFSYGGWTALSLGGVIGNLQGEIDECEIRKETSSHCADLARAGVSFEQLDAARWNASYKDARITHVFAIDPALHHGMDDSHTENLVDDVTMIGLGDGEDRLVATDFDISGFVDLVPQARVERIAPAYHFSMLPVCKPAGPAILEEEGDDPVCNTPAGIAREDIHEQVLKIMRAELGI